MQEKSTAFDAVDNSAQELKRWRDKKKLMWPLSLVPALAVFLAWGLVELTGSGLF
ncbi:hypothetical protein [Hoyosella rhizosphaerae]|uniref:Uncharacterized protein n=1 Tax=Hoyosella rhizosphaerae TaxID=1755582 RepID=A0A916UI51_9ACTN|nr:hypothetical protein [Hoyosella rhizosphaerae]GGC74115.1 hypothetical protein GCM10011410_29150 [Hoyosella rhizosphaerae]